MSIINNTSLDYIFYVFDLGFMCGTIFFLVPELYKLINFTYPNATKLEIITYIF